MAESPDRNGNPADAGPAVDDALLDAEAAEAGRAPDPARLSAADVLRIVPERAPPPPPTTAYRVAITLVSAVTCTMALLYVAMIAGAAWGLWWHLTESTIKFGSKQGTFSLRDYIGLAVLLVLILVMLIRPLFAKRAERTGVVTIAPEDEPALHAFVVRVARSVGAPVPAKIDIDAQVNASASFRRGFRSFRGDDLVLTIGTPLLAGMTVEQFASVLAHELGHFRQGLGMRLTYVAHTLEAWFARAAHERGKVDDAGAVIGAVRLGAWIMRKLFLGMHWVVRLAERLVSRRMETDADDHSLALVGGPATATAFRKLVLLDASHDMALSSSQSAYEQGQLPDDLPTLALGWRSRMPSNVARDVLDGAFSGRTSATATHPCIRERFERAAPRAPGPLRCDAPARSLLRDPARLFREATRRHFAEVTDGASSSSRIVPSAQLLDRADGAREVHAALGRWSQGVLSYLVLPRVSEWIAERPAAGGDPRESLASARDAFAALVPKTRAALETFDAADTRVAHALRVEAVLAARGAVAKIPDVPTITDRTEAGVARVLAEARASERGARTIVDAGHAALGRRLRAGLALLDSDAAGSAAHLVARLAAVDDAHDEVAALRERLCTYTGLVRERDERKNGRAAPALAAFAADVALALDRIREAVPGAASDGSSIADGVPAPAPVIPAADRAGTADDAYQAGRQGVDAFYAWWFQTMAHLAAHAESAESRADPAAAS